MLEFLGEREYVADIQASKEGRVYIFEIDGIKNHSTKRNIARDKARDRALFEIGKWTIRIPTRYLVGKGKLPDSDILKEIAWRISIIQKIIGVENVAMPYPKSIGDVLIADLHLEHTQ